LPLLKFQPSYIAIPEMYYSLNWPTHKLDFTSEYRSKCHTPTEYPLCMCKTLRHKHISVFATSSLSWE